MTSQTRSQAVRQSHHLHISPSCAHSKVPTVQHPQKPPMASQPIDVDKPSPPSSPQMPDSVIFSVLCFYDFVGNEPDLLSFSKGDILDIVKRDQTGWWAAMPKGSLVVGWIPHAFVKPLFDEMAEKLRNLDREFRVPEFEAEELYNSHTYDSGSHIFDSDSPAPSPIFEDFKSNSTSTLATSHHSKDSPPQTQLKRNLSAVPSASTGPSRPRSHPPPPPSPSVPMPLPPVTIHRSISLDKPTPPTPPLESEKHTSRSSSLSYRSRHLVAPVDPSTHLSNNVGMKTPKKVDGATSPDSCPSRSPYTLRLQRKTSKCKNVQKSPANKAFYLRPQYSGQIKEDEKGGIQFATLPALIEKLTTNPETTDLTKHAESNAFTTVFLTTFRTFTTANRLFELLTERFNMKIPKSLTEQEEKDWKVNLRDPVRRRILEVLRLWLVNYRLLEEEPHIAKRLTDFLCTIGEPHMSTAGKLIKDVERLTFLVPNKLSLAVSSKKTKKSKINKNDLLKQDPVVIAEQLTLWESSLYMDITPQECLNHAKSLTTKTLHLEKFCSTHAKLGGWVKKSILKHDILPKRADTADFWIRVAEKCRSLNNFASMSAISVALSSTVIQNLHLTWAHVNRKSHLEMLVRYNDPSRGFAGYRELMKKTQGPCVPFISMFLTDIVHINAQFKQIPQSDDNICFQQMTRWSDIITNILRFQGRKYNIIINESIAAFIEDQIRDQWDEEWSWTRSQEVQQSETAHADIRKGLEAAGF